jgi:hypothetical protein
MSKPTVADILKAWCELQGYDGLYHSVIECGCMLDDLIPCGSDPSLCQPGYKRKPDPNSEWADADWIIHTEKERS